jgi:hypothetical protein
MCCSGVRDFEQAVLESALDCTAAATATADVESGRNFSTESGMYACTVCSYTCYREKEMQSHFAKHKAGEVLVRCDVPGCDYKVLASASLYAHKKRDHSEEVAVRGAAVFVVLFT